MSLHKVTIDWPTFLTVKQFVREGADTHQQIIDKIEGGLDRSLVKLLVNLARLPVFVQDEYEKLLIVGMDSTDVRIGDINRLFATYNAEYAEYPDGNGPAFQYLWQGIADWSMNRTD